MCNALTLVRFAEEENLMANTSSLRKGDWSMAPNGTRIGLVSIGLV